MRYSVSWVVLTVSNCIECEPSQPWGPRLIQRGMYCTPILQSEPVWFAKSAYCGSENYPRSGWTQRISYHRLVLTNYMTLLLVFHKTSIVFFLHVLYYNRTDFVLLFAANAEVSFSCWYKYLTQSFMWYKRIISSSLKSWLQELIHDRILPAYPALEVHILEPFFT